MVDLGKKFEEIIKRDFSKLDNAKVTRLYDPVGGYMGIKNVCDFIAYKYPYSFYFEAKETKQNTFNLKKLTQYDVLLKYDNIKGLYPGVLVWFSIHNKVIWCSIKRLKWLKQNNFKSINIGDNTSYDFELDIKISKKYPIIDFDEFINKISKD